MASLPQGSCFCLISAGIGGSHYTCLAFRKGSRYPNSGSHVCVIRALFTEAWPRIPLQYNGNILKHKEFNFTILLIYFSYGSLSPPHPVLVHVDAKCTCVCLCVCVPVYVCTCRTQRSTLPLFLGRHLFLFLNQGPLHGAPKLD